MRSRLLVAVLVAGWATVAGARNDAGAALVGSWECGPTVMHGPDVDVTVITRITKNADHTYSDQTTSVIQQQGKAAITHQDTSHGTWQLDADIITTHVERVEFLSSSDPTLTRQQGQANLEAQLKKKSVYRSRLLYLDATSSRAVPVGSLYKAAEVETSCRRVGSGGAQQPVD